MLDKSNKPYFSIDQRIRQDLLILLTVNDQFHDDIRSLREKVGIPIDGYGTEYTVTDRTNDDLVNGVHAIRVKYNLSEAYDDELHILLMSEQAANTESINFLWHLRPFQVYNEDFPDEKLVAIKLYPETTLKDVIDYWPDIERMRNILLELKPELENKRQRKRDNLERDLLIYSLKKEGKTAKDITKVINDDERFTGSKVSYQDVSKIVQRLKDEAEEIMFGKYEDGINELDDF